MAALTALARPVASEGDASAPATSPHSAPRPQVVTVPPMGAVYPYIQHPLFMPYEDMWRKLPTAAFYVPGQRSFVFEVGSVKAPAHHTLIVTGYSIKASRLSGVSPGDTKAVEPGRLATCWGFDMRLSGARLRRCQYELQPQEIQTGRQANDTLPPTGRTAKPTHYVRAAAGQYGVPGGAGLALLPFRPERYGPPEGPFTIPVRDGQTLDLLCTIFKPLPIPLAFVEWSITGYQMPNTLFDAFMKQLTP